MYGLWTIKYMYVMINKCILPTKEIEKMFTWSPRNKPFSSHTFHYIIEGVDREEKKIKKGKKTRKGMKIIKEKNMWDKMTKREEKDRNEKLSDLW